MKAPTNNHYPEYENFIIKRKHPCVMAQTVFRTDKVNYKEYKNLGAAENATQILSDLDEYIKSYDFDSNEFYTFIAAFPQQKVSTEKEFEKLLWQQLQNLYEADHFSWDKDVAQDPDDDNFSFSLRGRAFYIVGMHPNSSRKARQSPFPTLVFNLHWQFEKLREMNIYEKVRDRIRKRDKKLQGNINPMLEDFGASSEARQYSGRKVEENWKCPFHHS